MCVCVLRKDRYGCDGVWAVRDPLLDVFFADVVNSLLGSSLGQADHGMIYVVEESPSFPACWLCVFYCCLYKVCRVAGIPTTGLKAKLVSAIDHALMSNFRYALYAVCLCLTFSLYDLRFMVNMS